MANTHIRIAVDNADIDTDQLAAALETFLSTGHPWSGQPNTRLTIAVETTPPDQPA